MKENEVVAGKSQGIIVLERKKKFFAVLPLLVIPFMIGAFHVFIKGQANAKDKDSKLGGINTTLPGASNKDGGSTDKMGYYQKAEKDSMQRNKQRQNDPFFQLSFRGSNPFEAVADTPGKGQEMIVATGYADANEQKVYQKLAQLRSSINQPEQPAQQNDLNNRQTENYQLKEDIARLEQMMSSMGASESKDPEMEQINTTLESILDIQHPERVTQKLRQNSLEQKGQVFSVVTVDRKAPITILDNRTVKQYAEQFKADSVSMQPENAFYTIRENTYPQEQPNAVAASIHENQTVTSGSTVKLRLATDIFINGLLVPKGHFVFGVANLQGERLSVGINNVQYGGSLLPVSLSVYDIDGIEGIRIPGAISRDAVKQSGDQSLSALRLGTLDASWGAQAASAGVELGKNLLGRKIKLIQVELKAGYRVLLKDEKKRDMY